MTARRLGTCYTLERYRVPDNNQAKLGAISPPGAPRFWWLTDGQKDPLYGADFERDDGGKGHDIGDYLHDQMRDDGAPRRGGGGLIGPSSRPAASYYPISIPEIGMPEGHSVARLPPPEEGPGNIADAHVEGGKFRGFAYCYSPRNIQRSVKAIHRVDGEIVPNDAKAYSLLLGPFFESDEYFYNSTLINLDSTRGAI